METYVDDAAVERCDNCSEPVEDCDCRCTNCDDAVDECACDEGPSYPATSS